MRKLLFCLLLLQSCVNDYQYKRIEPYYLFHANSSKVWVINHAYKKGKDVEPFSLNYKRVLSFHKSGNVYLHDLQDCLEDRGKKGVFYVDIEKRELEIVFKDQTWLFYMEQVSDNMLRLKAKESSANKMNLELIPFPEY